VSSSDLLAVYLLLPGIISCVYLLSSFRYDEGILQHWGCSTRVGWKHMSWLRRSEHMIMNAAPSMFEDASDFLPLSTYALVTCLIMIHQLKTNLVPRPAAAQNACTATSCEYKAISRPPTARMEPTEACRKSLPDLTMTRAGHGIVTRQYIFTNFLPPID
jgi:hypothetical protein